MIQQRLSWRFRIDKDSKRTKTASLPAAIEPPGTSSSGAILTRMAKQTLVRSYMCIPLCHNGWKAQKISLWGEKRYVRFDDDAGWIFTEATIRRTAATDADQPRCDGSPAIVLIVSSRSVIILPTVSSSSLVRRDLCSNQKFLRQPYQRVSDFQDTPTHTLSVFEMNHLCWFR